MDKHILNIQSALSVVDSVISSAEMTPVTKSTLIHLLDMIKSELNDMESLIAVKLKDPVDETRDRILTPIIFTQFTLYPHASEIEINGKRNKLPSLEFHIIYNLAINNGNVVKFKPTSSFNTHISVLRRTHPELKQLIEHVRLAGRIGCYRLHATAV